MAPELTVTEETPRLDLHEALTKMDSLLREIFRELRPSTARRWIPSGELSGAILPLALWRTSQHGDYGKPTYLRLARETSDGTVYLCLSWGTGSVGTECGQWRFYLETAISRHEDMPRLRRRKRQTICSDEESFTKAAIGLIQWIFRTVYELGTDSDWAPGEMGGEYPRWSRYGSTKPLQTLEQTLSFLEDGWRLPEWEPKQLQHCLADCRQDRRYDIRKQARDRHAVVTYDRHYPQHLEKLHELEHRYDAIFHPRPRPTAVTPPPEPPPEPTPPPPGGPIRRLFRR